VVYLTQTTDCLLTSDSRDDFWGGHNSLLLLQGAENPSYATDQTLYIVVVSKAVWDML